jgi:Fe-S oxidoreductase
LPLFANESLTDWFQKRSPLGNGSKGEVVLFHDTFNTFNTPSVAMDATRILEHGGYRVVLSNKDCCGRPLISKGMLNEAKKNATTNVERLVPYAQKGIPIVGLEPSCLLTLRDEYPDLLRSEAARQVASQSFLLEEFLLREREAGRLSFSFPRNGRRALLHGHCHQRALAGTGMTVAMLRWAGYDVDEVDSGCCGMAGSFGYEKEHYELSLAIGKLRLAPAVRDVGPEVELVAPGISRRQQIDPLTGRKARHPAELFWESLAQQKPE